MTTNTNGAAIPAARLARRHDVDALRILAFGLLIPFHVGMFYVTEWEWHVKSAYSAEWLQIPMLWSNQWRMSLIFLISGLAISFVWGRYGALRFAGRRIFRLLLPLLFGMAFIVAPQAYLEGMTKGVLEPGFWRFLVEYLTFGDIPDEAYRGAKEMTWTWNHLWYLPYLLFYTLALIPLAMLLDGPGRGIRDGFRRLRGVWLVIVPILPLIAYGNFIFPHFPYISHGLLDDAYGHALYGTFFLYGFLLGRDEGIWTELARLRRLTLTLAFASFAGLLAARSLIPDDSGGWLGQAQLIIIYLNRWLWIVAALGWGHAILNRPFRWLPYATEAVYPWYVLHQTITVIAGYQLSKLALGPVIEPALVLVVTIGGCFVLHEYVIRRTNLLRPFFGLSIRSDRRPQRKIAAGAATAAELS